MGLIERSKKAGYTTACQWSILVATVNKYWSDSNMQIYKILFSLCLYISLMLGLALGTTHLTPFLYEKVRAQWLNPEADTLDLQSSTILIKIGSNQPLYAGHCKSVWKVLTIVFF